MFTFVVRGYPCHWYVVNIITGGKSQTYTKRTDAEAVRDWLQFNR